MENKLEIFNSDQFGQIRTILINDEPYFCLADICKALSLEQVSRVKDRLKKVGVTTNKVIDSLGRNQDATFINEQNLYKCIFQSRTSKAENFQDWISSEVLPQIRKTGMYSKVPKTYAQALRMYANEVEQKELMQNQRDEAIRTKAWIGSKREATAMALASSKSRECKKLKTETEILKEELDQSKQRATIKFVEKKLAKLRKNFDWKALKKYCLDNNLKIKKIFDSNFVSVNSYPAKAWWKVYGVDLEELNGDQGD
ncbi:MAG: hypothetical protein LBJ32_00410 [Oscillospiraceae bacterium]|nr:hypothetical protein [Oscillospiraceae bacterium]